MMGDIEESFLGWVPGQAQFACKTSAVVPKSALPRVLRKQSTAVEDGEALHKELRMAFFSGQSGASLASGIECLPHLAPEQPHRWYAVYTWARHEKAVARHFEERGLTYFLPLYQALHRWNKRSCRVSLPLFPGYVFVRTGGAERYKPLQVPGVLHYAGTGTTPSAIADEEIESLRRILISGREVGPHPYLSAGQQVRIAAGPLAGLRGVIQRSKSGNRFVVSVETIKQSIAIELDGFQIASMQINPLQELLRAS